MDQSADRRLSMRLPFASKVICTVDGKEEKYCGTLRDMSITSLYMEAKNFPKDASSCNIDIILQGKYSRLRLEEIAGHVIRHGGDGVAISFDERLEWFALVPLYFHKGQESTSR
ncbi:MAG: hypothetical protein ACN4GW_08785 [Desulforhopalus sp.]